MKTVLIKPNTKKKQYGVTSRFSAIEPPVWLACLANCYDTVNIIDAEVDRIETQQAIYERIVSDAPNADRIVILATGSHPSAHIQQKEESEKLGKYLFERGYSVEVYDYLTFDPTTINLPRWDLIDLSKYRAHNWHGWGRESRQPYGAIFTTISCPYSCKFCTIKSFYRSNYKKRDIDKIIEDIGTQYHKYNVRNFKMMDELFLLPSKRTHDVLEAFETNFEDLNIWAYARIDTVNEDLLKRAKKAGITWLAYGIESGNYEIRKEMNKGTFTNERIKDIIKMTKDAGINVLGNYMFGFWEDNYLKMNETMDLAEKLNCEYSNFYCTVAYPGSPFYDLMKERGVDLPKETDEYAQMSPKFKPLSTRYLSAQQVLEFRDRMFNIYHSNPKYLSMMEKRFGENVVNEIRDMLNVKIEREMLK